MEMLSSKQKKIIIIAGAVIVCIFLYYMSTINRSYEYTEELENVQNEENIEENEDEIKSQVEKIVVHITGAVQTEGIVTIEKGDRIKDAIEAAGGLTLDANLDEVNLAYVLSDGQKIYIPSKSDTEEETIISEGSGETVIVDMGMENVNTKININIATIAELQGLSGIGEGTAQKIVEYRQLNGRFNTIEDIKNVSGIGEAKFDNIKDFICVE